METFQHRKRGLNNKRRWNGVYGNVNMINKETALMETF